MATVERDAPMTIRRVLLQTPLKAPKPPSMGITTPLTSPALGPQGQTTAPGSSSGTPNRPVGAWDQGVQGDQQ